MSQRPVTRTSFAIGLGLAAACAMGASAPAAAGAWTLGLETRFLNVNGGISSSGGSAVDDQFVVAPLRATMDELLVLDLHVSDAGVDAIAAQSSVVEPQRLLASGNTNAFVVVSSPNGNAVGAARSKYEVEFMLDQPTRLRFEARVGESGLGEAVVQIRQGIFQVVRGITSDGPETTIDEFITLPAGNYSLLAETQLNVVTFQPAALSGSGEFTVLLAPSNATLVGDLNCDGIVSVGDIGPFVLALTQPAEYVHQFPNCEPDNGDINADGVVSVGDIGQFVQLLLP